MESNLDSLEGELDHTHALFNIFQYVIDMSNNLYLNSSTFALWGKLSVSRKY
jgi:hypothetical protein